MDLGHLLGSVGIAGESGRKREKGTKGLRVMGWTKAILRKRRSSSPRGDAGSQTESCWPAAWLQVMGLRRCRDAGAMGDASFLGKQTSRRGETPAGLAANGKKEGRRGN